MKQKVLMLASVASMIDQFNMSNIRLIQDMGYEVHVLCNFKKGNTCDGVQICRFKRKLDAMGAVRHQWDCPRKIFPLQKCLKAYRQLCRLMDQESFAWMHCHSPLGGAAARAAAHRAGVPVIYTAHGFHFYKGAPFKNWMLYYPAEWLLARWTDVLITINKEDYRLAKRRLKAGKVCYLPGAGVDTKKYARRADHAAALECRRKFGIPEHARMLLSVGELSARKNHQAVIRALAALNRKDVYYLICGQGALRRKLIRQAEKLGVADRVRMPGFQKDLAGLYAAADIFVFPSCQEGMPMALMEAMAAGLACVVSDIRGNHELIGTQKKQRDPFLRSRISAAGGLRFCLQKPYQLQAALALLLEDQQLRQECGVRNRKKIKSYALEQVQSRMRVIYENAAVRMMPYQKPVQNNKGFRRKICRRYQ